jgi:hypothetical protein
MSENSGFIELTEAWRLRARTYQKAHYDAAEALRRRNYFFGVPIIALSAIVGTSVFATISEGLSLWSRVVVGLVSITVAVLSALQTFFRFTERAEQHREAAIKYGALNRELERMRAFAPASTEAAQSATLRIEQTLNELAEHSPAIPMALLSHTRHQLALPPRNER